MLGDPLSVLNRGAGLCCCLGLVPLNLFGAPEVAAGTGLDLALPRALKGPGAEDGLLDLQQRRELACQQRAQVVLQLKYIIMIRGPTQR